MPVETTSPRVIPADALGVDQKIDYDPRDSAWKILIRKDNKPEKSVDPDDEYNYQGIKLNPLRSVTVEVKESTYSGELTRQVNLDDKLKSGFDYLSATHSLEVNTPKTQFLQSIVDRMIDTLGIDPMKVVVMNKGAKPEAFVFADGTMFVSQSLLNSLDSVDEIGGVLAHEIGHIVNKTTEKSIQAGDPSHEFGVGWSHETASDLLTPYLLNKMGLNSLAGASAIQKIAGAERGDIHQTGHTRASQIVGLHGAKDYPTSKKKPTPKAQELVGEAISTNLEIFTEKMKKIMYEKKVKNPELTDILRRLHPKDFAKAYEEIHQYISYGFLEDAYSLNHQSALEQANQVVIEKLDELGITEKLDQQLFMISLSNKTYGADPNLYLFQDPQLIVDLSAQASSFLEKDILQIASKRLFDRQYTGHLLNTFADLISINLYDINFPFALGHLPVTRDSLLETLANLNRVTQTSEEAAKTLKDTTTRALLKYVDYTFLRMATETGDEIDTEQIRAFFMEAKNLGIPISEAFLNRDTTYYLYIELESKKKIKVDQENVQNIIQTIREVYGFIKPEGSEYKPYMDYERIDSFFEGTLGEMSSQEAWAKFVGELRRFADFKSLTDAQRSEFVHYIDQKIAGLSTSIKMDISAWLNDVRSLKRIEELSDEQKKLNDRFVKFNLRAFLALSVFQNDGPEFYQYVEHAMGELNVDPNSLSLIQLINLCHGFLSIGSSSQEQKDTFLYGQGYSQITKEALGGYGREGHISVKNYDQYFGLPLLKNLLQRSQTELPRFDNLADLNAFLAKEFPKTGFFKAGKDQMQDLFDDSPFELIFGRSVRQNFLEITQKGIKESDLGNLYNFLQIYYPPGVVKDEILREVNKRYLKSGEVSFEQKLDYLVEHYSNVGVEGMSILAEQIEDFQTYLIFHSRMEDKIKSYITGSSEAAVVATSDVATSYLSGYFGTVLETAKDDLKTRLRSSADFASSWFSHYFSEHSYSSAAGKVKFDRETRKFINTREVRSVFETVSDSFKSLKSLSQFKRFLIAQKTLTDRNGAFSSARNRRILSDILVSSIGVKNGFIKETLKTAAWEGDPKFITFPAANILAPLLFRSLNVKSIIFPLLGKSQVERKTGKKDEFGRDVYTMAALDKVLASEEIRLITSSGTREITFFGADYRYKPNSEIANIAQESDQQYYLVRQSLIDLLGAEEAEELLDETIKKGKELDLANEAIIRGVEGSGALGVRSLQIMSQLLRIKDPALRERLSQSFDANPGLNKLLFWENLRDLAEIDPQVKQLLERVKLKGYLGGGSLYTTFEGVMTNEDGSKEEVVLKLLRPNAEAFVDESFNLTKGILESVTKRNRHFRGYVNKALMVLGLSKEWCKADINDPSFEADDDQFAGVVRGFNQSQSREVFYLPQRRLNTSRLKVETKARGQTINKLLKDPDIPEAVKVEAVRQMSEFFLYQLNTADQLHDQDGQGYRLIHSDPHIGNYVIDIEGNHPRIGVIDRHMYLKLSGADSGLISKFIKGGNVNDLVYSFLTRALDINGKTNPSERSKVTNFVFRNLALEYVRQLSRGGVDRMLLLNSMLTHLADVNINIPLNLRLMVRNVEALRALTGKYNLKIYSS